MIEDSISNPDPQYRKFLVETSDQYSKDHEKYRQDIEAYGKQMLQEKYQLWRQKQQQQQLP